MTVSIEQIRAARALLGLSQKELAEKAGISLNSLNNIERGVASPRQGSIDSIRFALEEEGIEFLEGNGVRPKGERLEIEKIEGTDPIHVLEQFYGEFLKAFPAGGGEVLYIGIDNSRINHLRREKLRVYKKFEEEAIKRGIEEKLLFLEGDVNFISERNNYRWVPKELFGQIPMAIYDDNVAIVLWGPPSRMIVIRNTSIAETFRRQFEAVWSLGTPVPDEIHKFHKAKPQDWTEAEETKKSASR
jgi:transcriptional regulator with XRE-family HTH domain